MIKLFMNRGQIRLLNSKTTDLDWYYSKPCQKLKLAIHDLLFRTFVNPPSPLLSDTRSTNFPWCSYRPLSKVKLQSRHGHIKAHLHLASMIDLEQIGDSLEALWWLVSAIDPNILRGSGDLWMVLCHSMNACSVIWIPWGCGDTQTLPCATGCKNFGCEPPGETFTTYL